MYFSRMVGYMLNSFRFLLKIIPFSLSNVVVKSNNNFKLPGVVPPSTIIFILLCPFPCFCTHIEVVLVLMANSSLSFQSNFSLSVTVAFTAMINCSVIFCDILPSLNKPAIPESILRNSKAFEIVTKNKINRTVWAE